MWFTKHICFESAFEDRGKTCWGYTPECLLLFLNSNSQCICDQGYMATLEQRCTARFCLVESKNNLGTGEPCDLFLSTYKKLLVPLFGFIDFIYVYLLTQSISEGGLTRWEKPGLQIYPFNLRNQSHVSTTWPQSLGSSNEIEGNLLSKQIRQ